MHITNTVNEYEDIITDFTEMKGLQGNTMTSVHKQIR